jgi:uncharacterized protein
MSITRRAFIQRSALAGGFTIAGPLEAFAARLGADSARRRRPTAPGYGPLSPREDDATGLALLALPEGFKYCSYGWTGDPLDGGQFTPAAHDGMAAFRGQGQRVLLVRNHEESSGDAFDRAISYDPGAAGGTTTIEFDEGTGAWVGGRTSLAGTVRNCAGGATPWGTWLTCEESLVEPAPEATYKREHGYVFEVPLSGKPTCEPLVAMGRFVHEAVAVDPATGIVYETEDSGSSGLYRFIPKVKGDLARGGTLEMLAIDRRPRFDTRTGQAPEGEYPVTWVPIDHADRGHSKDKDGQGVYAQGFALGGATFARLEGAWYGGGKIFITATSGGDAKKGQVWELDPVTQRLRLVYESPGVGILNMPDNICVSPRGGLVLCEDGDGTAFVHGLTVDGSIFQFIRNCAVIEPGRGRRAGDFSGSELAGATFSPNGEWLFINMQSPGITFAITGPWADGAL